MRPVHRFFAAVITVQILGSILGLILEVAVTWWMRAAIGGMMATPLAYAAGVFFQRRRPGEEKRSPEETAFGLLMGAIALGIGATAWFDDWPAERRKIARVQALREMDAGTVSALRVFNTESGRDVEFAEPETIREFFESCRDVECVGGARRGGPTFVVEFSGATPMMLECHDLSPHNDAVAGYLLAGTWTADTYQVRFLGAFRSDSLGKWFAHHLPPPPTR